MGAALVKRLKVSIIFSEFVRLYTDLYGLVFVISGFICAESCDKINKNPSDRYKNAFEMK